MFVFRSSQAGTQMFIHKQDRKKLRKHCREKRMLLCHIMETRLWPCLHCATLDMSYLEYHDKRQKFKSKTISREVFANSMQAFQREISQHFMHTNSECYSATANGCVEFAHKLLSSL